MSTFFHGWRRKLGCVTLVIACVTTVLWVRSCIVIDNFRIPIGDRRLQIALFRGAAYLETCDIPKFRDTTRPLRGTPRYDWRVRPVDSTIRSESWNLQGPTKCVPFRHFAVVFGLLASYLILWKPRKVVATSKPETPNA